MEKDWCLPLTGFDHFTDIEGSRAIATADSKGEQHQSSFFSESSLHTNFSASQSVKQ